MVARGVWGSGGRAGDQVFRHQQPEGVEAEEWLSNSVKGQSHPRPEPWPLTGEGISAKDGEEGWKGSEVGSEGGDVPWEASEASASGKRGDGGAPSCLWPC